MAIVVPEKRDGQEFLITRAGYEQLREEIDHLVGVRRPELAERLRAARGDGDLDDNPELAEALAEHERLEQRVAVLETQLALARTVDDAPPDGLAAVGTRVVVRDLDGGDELVLDLVGAIEADAARGRFSIASPVGQALLGRREGELVDVDAPGGKRRLAILAVEPSPTEMP